MEKLSGNLTKICIQRSEENANLQKLSANEIQFRNRFFKQFHLRLVFANSRSIQISEYIFFSNLRLVFPFSEISWEIGSGTQIYTLVSVMRASTISDFATKIAKIQRPSVTDQRANLSSRSDFPENFREWKN